MSDAIGRRRVLERLAGGAAVVGGSGALAWLGRRGGGRFQPRASGRTLRDHRVAEDRAWPPIAVAHGGSPAARARAAVAALGGMGRFVAPGERVLLKPNMSWDRTPEQGANTHPDVVAEVVRLCREAGAAQVIVTDNPVHDPGRVLERSGIAAAVQAAGGEIVMPAACGFEWAELSGSLLQRWEVLGVLLRADRLINLPVVKHHSLSRLTCGFKNHMGLIGGSRGRLHQEIHASLLDLASALRPTLTVVDATRVMMRNGPTGGRLDDLRAVDLVAAGSDPVACDAWAARLLGLDPFDVPHVAQAEGRGLGRVANGAGPLLEVAARG